MLIGSPNAPNSPAALPFASPSRINQYVSLSFHDQSSFAPAFLLGDSRANQPMRSGGADQSVHVTWSPDLVQPMSGRQQRQQTKRVLGMTSGPPLQSLQTDLKRSERFALGSGDSMVARQRRQSFDSDGHVLMPSEALGHQSSFSAAQVDPFFTQGYNL